MCKRICWRDSKKSFKLSFSKFLYLLGRKMQVIVRFLLVLLMIATVRGRHLDCNKVEYQKICYNSQTQDLDECWGCGIHYKNIFARDNLTISGQHGNGSRADIDFVVFVGGHINKLPRVFDNSTNQEIMQMMLINTNTTALNAEFFAPQSGGNLISFSIMDTLRTTDLLVESSAFQYCASLKFFTLIGTRILSIALDAFVGLHKLEGLALIDNGLDMIHPKWFQDLHNLHEIDLSENKLKRITDGTFAHLTNLKELSLKGNQIATISKKTFEANELLEFLDLSNNRIKTIQIGSFQHLTHLTGLNLLNNTCINVVIENETLEVIGEELMACYPTTCIIPNISNGRVVRVDDNSRQVPGNFFALNKSVKVICQRKYSTIQFVNKCEESGWKNDEWPECESE